MEYSEKEREILAQLGRKDFKNISKTEILGYVSDIQECRPEFAERVLSQYPDLIKFAHNSLAEQKALAEKAINSSDKSSDHYFETSDHVLSDLSKCLDMENLSPEERKDILNREMEILRMAKEKDSETKEFDWKTLSTYSYLTIIAVTLGIGLGIGLLSGKGKISFPKNIL